MKIMNYEITEKQMAAWVIRHCLENGDMYSIPVSLTDKQHEKVCEHITNMTSNLSKRVDNVLKDCVDEVEGFIEEKNIKLETSGY